MTSPVKSVTNKLRLATLEDLRRDLLTDDSMNALLNPKVRAKVLRVGLEYRFFFFSRLHPKRCQFSPGATFTMMIHSNIEVTFYD